MTNARNRAFLPQGNLQSSYHAVCASDADRSVRISKISNASCRRVLLFIAVGSEFMSLPIIIVVLALGSKMASQSDQSCQAEKDGAEDGRKHHLSPVHVNSPTCSSEPRP
jgi:hypothetical protein